MMIRSPEDSDCSAASSSSSHRGPSASGRGGSRVALAVVDDLRSGAGGPQDDDVAGAGPDPRWGRRRLIGPPDHAGLPCWELVQLLGGHEHSTGFGPLRGSHHSPPLEQIHEPSGTGETHPELALQHRRGP